MEFVYSTPTHTTPAVVPGRSKSKIRSRSRSRLFAASGSNTPDRFIPSRYDPKLNEFTSHEISKSVRKKQDSCYNSSVNVHSKELFLDKRSILPIQRLLYYNSPSVNNTQKGVMWLSWLPVLGVDFFSGYWDGYTLNQRTIVKENKRIIPTNADHILNAPNVIDDFYLNLLHWGKRGSIAVGLGTSVYLLNPRTLEAIPMFTSSDESFPSAVQWNPGGCGLAVGLSNAELQMWDPHVCKLTRTIKMSSSRIGCISWHPKHLNLICTGSQSGEICLYDIRISNTLTKLSGHTMDVCSLEWSPSGQYLGSGGNDNIVNIWNTNGIDSRKNPIMTFKEHRAAVKGLSWCPWQSSLIATGGGTADKTLHIWNVTSGVASRSVETMSQISGIVWSFEYKQLLTSHGYEENTLMIWDSNILHDPLATLKGHSKRILHLTISPDGQEVATVAADETLRIWKCFTNNNGTSCKRTFDYCKESFERELLLNGL